MIGVAEIAERPVPRRPARLEPIAMPLLRARVHAEHLGRALEIRMVTKQALEMADPVAALADLTVGDARNARSERCSNGREYFGRAGERHAADEIDASTCHCGRPRALFSGRLTAAHP